MPPLVRESSRPNRAGLDLPPAGRRRRLFGTVHQPALLAARAGSSAGCAAARECLAKEAIQYVRGQPSRTAELRGGGGGGGDYSFDRGRDAAVHIGRPSESALAR